MPATKYKDANIAAWFRRKRFKIKSFGDNLYKKLSENEYVKKSLDDYLEKKKNK